MFGSRENFVRVSRENEEKKKKTKKKKVREGQTGNEWIQGDYLYHDFFVETAMIELRSLWNWR